MAGLDPLDLIHLQLDLECIGADFEGALFRLPGDPRVPIGYFLILRHAAGFTTYVHHEAGQVLAAQLRALPPQQAFEAPEALLHTLYGDASEVRLCYFSSYYFDHAPARGGWPDVICRDGNFVILAGGEVASRAWSTRSNARAAEVMVETCVTYRRRGYARQTCRAWACHQLAAGRIAFYSHNRDNLGSRALAASLGVIHFVDGVWCYG